MLALTALMGGSVVPDFLGIVAGHLYYFVTVLQPRAGAYTRPLLSST
jgi:Derlin-2/3